MSYITKDFLNTQFTNYSSKVEEVFRKKSDSYSKEDVDALIAAVNGMSKEIVDELPTDDISESTIYFLPNDTNNGYTEYIYLNGEWEPLGSTDNVNIDGYVTDNDLTVALDGYLEKTDVETENIDFSGYFTQNEEA